MINASGSSGRPRWEALLFKHPLAVQEACIIAARDEYRGETVKAVVVLRAEARQDRARDIIAWAREHMAAYKVPKIVEFVDSPPKSGLGQGCGGCCRTARDRSVMDPVRAKTLGAARGPFDKLQGNGA